MIVAAPVSRYCDKIAVVGFVIGRRHEHVDVPTDDFGAGIAEQPLGPAIERFDASLRVDDDDAVDRRVDDGSQPRIRVSQVRGADARLCLQVLIRAAERVGALPVDDGQLPAMSQATHPSSPTAGRRRARSRSAGDGGPPRGSPARGPPRRRFSSARIA